MKQKTIFLLSALVLLLVFIAGVFVFSTQKNNQASQLAEVNQTALIRMHSPSLGSADAPVVIVEFLDPACETCSAFYPLVKEMMASNPGKIRLVLRYAPFHNGSDKVAGLLEAARKQGKFWPALELLLSNQPAWTAGHSAQPDRALQLLGKLGLNPDQMAFDLLAPEIGQVIAQDLQDAKTLNVTKTPEFFVNGKPLPSFGIEQLRTLVAQELSKASLGK